MRSFEIGDRVMWHDPWREDWGVPMDTREWTVFDINEDMVCICTGTFGSSGYAEAEVPPQELTRYGVANTTMAVRTAKNLVAALRAKGVKCECNYEYKPIRDVLRDCWYVKKLVECGRTQCIHIGLPDAGSFIAVTNDCKLMTGYHVMIQDAIYSIYYEYVESDVGFEPYDTIRMGRGRFYHDEWGDCGMLLMDPHVFVNWLNSLDFYEQTEEPVIEEAF